MSEHTPGPWRLDGLAISASMEVVVCWVGEPAQYPGDIATFCFNHEANARLIAATPELLEALRDLAEAARNEVGPKASPSLSNALFEADVAIAKAEGRA